jgi:hypothetical protein
MKNKLVAVVCLLISAVAAKSYFSYTPVSVDDLQSVQGRLAAYEYEKTKGKRSFSNSYINLVGDTTSYRITGNAMIAFHLNEFETDMSRGTQIRMLVGYDTDDRKDNELRVYALKMGKTSYLELEDYNQEDAFDKTVVAPIAGAVMLLLAIAAWLKKE